MQILGAREVTSEEVGHYNDCGWVMLKNFVSPNAVADLRERAEALVGSHAPDRTYVGWLDHHDAIDDDAGFRSLAISRTMGVNAQRLIGRNVGVRIWSNSVTVKPGKSDPATSGSAPWHQDAHDVAIDRPDWVRFWIALDQVTPEMGAINFLDRSHRLGPLGEPKVIRYEPACEIGARLAALGSFQDIGAVTLEPGDATAHGMYVLHGSPPNTTSNPRWAFVCSYFAEDVRYTATKTSGYGYTRARQAGLSRGDGFRNPFYPKVCDPL